MQEAVDQEVALADLEAGESITFDMPMMLASGETGTKSVTVTAGSWYYYADYGLGSYLTCPYYVKWGSINATAYCVEPSKKGPGNGTYTIQKLADGKTLAKVCYYGTKASDENGFFDEKHPDFPAGKRFIITHLAAAYANGSSDWASGTNATGKNLAMELYNYCVNMPDIPSVDMSFSESNVKLKIIKKDAETQKSVLLANTEFKVYDLDNQKYVEQTTSYPKPTVHKSYFTNEEGYLVLPKNLKPGNYRIEEVTAPDGYTISKNYVTVAVDTDTAYLTDPVTGDAVIDVEYTNAPVKGQLKIYKQGEVLKGFDKDFQYEMAGLAGAEFEVYAAEDIYTADHQVDADGQRTLYFAKDALVATVTTDTDGYATVKNTCEVQHVTMVDEKKPAEKTPEGGKPVSDSPKTGDNTNLWLWFMLLGIGATGTGALAFMRKKKH